MSNLSILKGLQYLDVSYNKITILQGLELMHDLKVFRFAGNQITQLNSLRCLSHNHNLVEISVVDNPVALNKDLRRYVHNVIPSLRVLDRHSLRTNDHHGYSYVEQQPHPRTPRGTPRGTSAKAAANINVAEESDDDSESNWSQAPIIDVHHLANTAPPPALPQNISTSTIRSKSASNLPWRKAPFPAPRLWKGRQLFTTDEEYAAPINRATSPINYHLRRPQLLINVGGDHSTIFPMSSQHDRSETPVNLFRDTHPDDHTPHHHAPVYVPPLPFEVYGDSDEKGGRKPKQKKDKSGNKSDANTTNNNSSKAIIDEESDDENWMNPRLRQQHDDDLHASYLAHGTSLHMSSPFILEQPLETLPTWNEEIAEQWAVKPRITATRAGRTRPPRHSVSPNRAMILRHQFTLNNHIDDDDTRSRSGRIRSRSRGRSFDRSVNGQEEGEGEDDLISLAARSINSHFDSSAASSQPSRNHRDRQQKHRRQQQSEGSESVTVASELSSIVNGPKSPYRRLVTLKHRINSRVGHDLAQIEDEQAIPEEWTKLPRPFEFLRREDDDSQQPQHESEQGPSFTDLMHSHLQVGEVASQQQQHAALGTALSAFSSSATAGIGIPLGAGFELYSELVNKRSMILTRLDLEKVEQEATSWLHNYDSGRHSLQSLASSPSPSPQTHAMWDEQQQMQQPPPLLPHQQQQSSNGYDNGHEQMNELLQEAHRLNAAIYALRQKQTTPYRIPAFSPQSDDHHLDDNSMPVTADQVKVQHQQSMREEKASSDNTTKKQMSKEQQQIFFPPTPPQPQVPLEDEATSTGGFTEPLMTPLPEQMDLQAMARMMEAMRAKQTQSLQQLQALRGNIQ